MPNSPANRVVEAFLEIIDSNTPADTVTPDMLLQKSGVETGVFRYHFSGTYSVAARLVENEIEKLSEMHPGETGTKGLFECYVSFVFEHPNAAFGLCTSSMRDVFMRYLTAAAKEVSVRAVGRVSKNSAANSGILLRTAEFFACGIRGMILKAIDRGLTEDTIGELMQSFTLMDRIIPQVIAEAEKME